MRLNHYLTSFALMGLLAACSSSGEDELSRLAEQQEAAAAAAETAGISQEDSEYFDMSMVTLPDEARVLFDSNLSAEARGRVRYFQTQVEQKDAGEGVVIKVEQGPGALIYATAEEGAPLMMGVFYGKGAVRLGAASTAQGLIHMKLNEMVSTSGGTPTMIRTFSEMAPQHPNFPEMSIYVGQLIEQGNSPYEDARSQEMAAWIARELGSGKVQ